MIRLVLGYLLARLLKRLILAAYGTPTDPVTGTVITVAYAIANLLNPIRALRALTGGADPPGTGYVVESTSTSATSWVLVNAAKIASWLGYTPANKAGESFTNNVAIGGNLNVGGTTTTGPINAGAITGSTGAFSGAVNIGGTMTAGPINAGAYSGSTGTFTGALSALSGAFTNAVSAASAAIVGAITAASATISGTMSANAIAVTSTTEVANLNAAALSGADWHAGLTGENTAGASPTGTFADVSSAAVTLDRAGRWMILAIANFTMSAVDGVAEIRIVLNGVAQTPIGWTPGVNSVGQTAAATHVIASASATHIAKIQARFASGGGFTNLNNARISAIWLAP